MPKILYIEEDTGLVDSLIEELQKQNGYQIEIVDPISLDLSLMSDRNFNFVLTDFYAHDSKGQNVLDHFVEYFPETHCIVFSKNATIKDSVEAIKRGAFNYLTGTEKSEDIIAEFEKTGEERKLYRKINKKTESRGNFNFRDLIGNSPEIVDLLDTIGKVASTDSTVLVTGESGTGKELIAMAIHYNSDRSDKPMVVINCGAIPGELLESELFGHEKGSFTGAHRSRIGRFEMANGGSIFLDEIGDMSPDLQVKLLRVLQEQSFERVGSTRSIKVDIRIIAATNKDLISSIEEGKFREDLYYRLNVIPIKVPPLRERKSDIPVLISHFIKRLGGRRKYDLKRMKTFSDEAMEVLMKYDWPGNIRELENMVERLSVLVEHDVIKVTDLPERVRGKVPGIQQHALIPLKNDVGFNDAVEQYQKNLILQALNQTNWIKSKAAELLKINRTTLVEKIKKMQLESFRE